MPIDSPRYPDGLILWDSASKRFSRHDSQTPTYHNVHEVKALLAFSNRLWGHPLTCICGQGKLLVVLSTVIRYCCTLMGVSGETSLFCVLISRTVRPTWAPQVKVGDLGFARPLSDFEAMTQAATKPGCGAVGASTITSIMVPDS